MGDCSLDGTDEEKVLGWGGSVVYMLTPQAGLPLSACWSLLAQ